MLPPSASRFLHTYTNMLIYSIIAIIYSFILSFAIMMMKIKKQMSVAMLLLIGLALFTSHAGVFV